MPWQSQVLDTALEVDEAGQLVYRDVVLTVPRQSGKTTIALTVILLRALKDARQQIRYTAQTGADARKKWQDDWLPLLNHSAFAKYLTIRQANGHEALLFKNGSIQSLVATTPKSGHGASIDLAILDEAFGHSDSRLEQALRPAMITRPEPQLWVISTAGTPDQSPYLLNKVENGRQLAAAGVTEGFAYFEWSAEDGADPGDPETWRSCMPALGTTVKESSVAADFQAMDTSEFQRSHLNQWTRSMVQPVISLETWQSLTDRHSSAEDPVSIAFDITPDRSRSAIAVAGKRSDGLSHIEVTDHRPGTGWLVDRVEELVKKHRPSGVFCDLRGAAASLVDELVDRGIEVTQLSASDQTQACGQLYDAAMQDRLRHLGTTELTTAISGATKRSLAGAWAWNRPASGGVDISPLVSCTIALWGAGQARDTTQGIWSLDEVVAQMQQRQYDGESTLSTMPPPPPPPFRSGFLTDRPAHFGISFPDIPQ